LPLLVAVSIAASRCRFSLPFGRVKTVHGKILILGIFGVGDLVFADHCSLITVHCEAVGCCNYLLTAKGHTCLLDVGPCKLFNGRRCVAFEKMHPGLFQAARQKTERNYTGKPATLPKKCRCGTMFEPGSNRQSLCPECGAQRRRLKKRGYLKISRKRKQPQPATPKKVRTDVQ